MEKTANSYKGIQFLSLLHETVLPDEVLLSGITIDKHAHWDICICDNQTQLSELVVTRDYQRIIFISNESPIKSPIVETIPHAAFAAASVQIINILHKQVLELKSKEDSINGHEIMDAANDGIICYIREAASLPRFEHINQKVKELLGLPDIPAHLISTDQIDPNNEWLLNEDMYRQLISHSKVYKEVDFEINSHIVRIGIHVSNIGGTYSHRYIAMLHDVSEQAIEREYFNTTLEFYYRLFDDAPAMIWRSDLSGGCDFSNIKWMEFTGQSEEDAKRKGWLSAIAPEEQARVYGAYIEAFRRRQGYYIEAKMMHHKKGFRWVQMYGKPYNQIDGHFAGMMHYCYDIQERKQEQDALARSLKEIRIQRDTAELYFNAAGVLMMILDDKGNILLLNDWGKKLLGYFNNSYQNDNWFNDFIRTRTRRRLFGKLQSCFANDSVEGFESYEVEIENKQNEFMYVSISNTLIHDPGHKSKVLLCSGEDITTRVITHQELVRAKEEAEEADRTKALFMANISHELRTPLNGVVGMTSLLKEQEPREDQIGYLDLLDISANNLLRIISDILDYSRLGTGALKIIYSPFKISSLLHEVYTVHLGRAQEKKLSFLLPPSESYDLTTIVISDHLRVKQIISNLVDNSLKFTSKGHVSIRTELMRQNNHSGELVISVIDSGVGIEQEDQDLIFKEFQQIENPYIKVHQGMGLGLSIVKRLTHRLSGKVKVSSTPGKGSTFTVRLPVEIPG